MGEEDLRILAEMNAIMVEVSAIQIKVDGMKAENMQRTHMGESMAYTSIDFGEAARNLKLLAARLRNEI